MKQENEPELPKLLLSRTRAAAMLDVSTDAFDDLRNRPDFPRPVLILKMLRWRAADLERWSAKLKPMRSAKLPPVCVAEASNEL